MCGQASTYTEIGSIFNMKCKEGVIYSAFVLPHLDYCSTVWHSYDVTLTQKIECVQNYALHIIIHQPPGTSSMELQQRFNMTSLERRQQIALACEVHRCLTDRTPAQL